MSDEVDIRLSANTINMVLECPFKYYLYRNVDRPPVKETKYIATGQAIHQFMEDMFDDGVREDEYYINASYLKEGDRNYDRREEYVVPDEMMHRFKTCKENALEWYSDREFRTEESFSKVVKTPKGRTILLTGYIDAQDDDTVIDWKTGSKVVGNTQYERQAHVYDFATDFEKNVKFVSLLSGDTLKIQHAPDYIPKICDEVMDIIEGCEFFRKDNFDFMCYNFCEFYEDYCSPGRDYIQIE